MPSVVFFLFLNKGKAANYIIIFEKLEPKMFAIFAWKKYLNILVLAADSSFLIDQTTIWLIVSES